MTWYGLVHPLVMLRAWYLYRQTHLLAPGPRCRCCGALFVLVGEVIPPR
jgi:hypothetical protein